MWLNIMRLKHVKASGYKNIAIVSFILTIATVLVSCNGSEIEIDNKNKKPLVGLQTPTPVPHKKGEAKVMEIINKTFTRCVNDADRNLSYAFIEGKYLIEIQDLVYNNGFWSSIFGMSPVELSADETWKSDVYFRAEVTGKYDIYTHQWVYKEGKPDCKDDKNENNPKCLPFSIKRIEGKWVCEGCDYFKPVTCEEVQKLLDEKPRYQNKDE
jgi:hypothetical protein